MSSAPWFRFFPTDWISGVAQLSAAERGVYVTLIAMIYDAEGPVPLDESRLARACGIPVHGFRRALDALVDLDKLQIEDGKITNKRAKTELTERASRVDRARDAASSSWDKRKKNQHSKNGSALPEQSEPNATRAPVTTTTTDSEIDNSISEKRAQARAAFARFWNAWPHKVGKPAAEKAFAKVVDEIEIILVGIESYIRDKPPDRPWLNPATFLNQRRWEDQPAAATPQQPRVVRNRGGFGTLLAENQERKFAGRDQGRGAAEAVQFLPFDGDSGRGAGEGDAGVVSGDVVQLLVGNSLKRV